MNPQGIGRIVCALVAALACSEARAVIVTLLGSDLQTPVATHRYGEDLSSFPKRYHVSVAAQQFIAFCVDFEHEIQSSWDANISHVDVLDDVYGHHAPIPGTGRAVGWLFDNFAGSADTPLEVAGLQIAIWEILDEFNNLNLNSGIFRLLSPQAVKDQANFYLAAIPPNVGTYEPAAYVLRSKDQPRSQHLIVPEPAALALLAIGFPLLSRARRGRASAADRRAS